MNYTQRQTKHFNHKIQYIETSQTCDINTKRTTQARRSADKASFWLVKWRLFIFYSLTESTNRLVAIWFSDKMYQLVKLKKSFSAPLNTFIQSENICIVDIGYQNIIL